jgi:hypothetical protein
LAVPGFTDGPPAVARDEDFTGFGRAVPFFPTSAAVTEGLDERVTVGLRFAMNHLK